MASKIMTYLRIVNLGATGAAANGARREADRERLTVRGHLLRPPLPGNSGQGNNDWAAKMPGYTGICPEIVAGKQ